MKSIGQRIQKIRNELGFPQKQVADILGVQRPNYSKIEHDKQNLTPHQIKLLCEFLDVSADYILDIHVSDQQVITKYEKDDIIAAVDKIKDTLK